MYVIAWRKIERLEYLMFLLKVPQGGVMTLVFTYTNTDSPDSGTDEAVNAWCKRLGSCTLWSAGRKTQTVTQKGLKSSQSDVEVHSRPSPFCYRMLLHFMDDRVCLTPTVETRIRLTGAQQRQRENESV